MSKRRISLHHLFTFISVGNFNFRDRISSFKYAFKGIKVLLWAEHNFRIHLVAAIIVVVLGLYLDVAKFDWLWLILAISLVLISEAINTAIEYLVDLIEPNHNPLAGKIKDIAAGAVLISAITSIIIGLIVLLPYLIETKS